MPPTLLLIVLCAVALVVLGTVLALVRRARSRHPQSRVQVTVRGRSADEACVKLSVEATLELDPQAPTDVLRTASQHLAPALRSCVATRRLLALPGAGDHLDLAVEVPGATVQRIVVTAADVEVTRELRRLVGGP